MDGLLDSIRKDIDAAMADYQTKYAAFLKAERELDAAEIKVETLRQAEINLEYEIERISK
jgi:DNA repair ATPase RecN